MTTDHTPLGDDLPKKNPWREDRLGVAPFAERISKVIQNLQAPNGYVIGLQGAWGSGKSTVLNFVTAYLERFNEAAAAADKITIINFRPWIVAGHQDLIAAFFKLIAESLEPREVRWKRQKKRMVRSFGFGSEKLVDTVAALAVTADPTGGIASGTAGAVAKGSLRTMVDRFLEEPSLQVVHQNLVKQLAASGRRFLVVIDDLDRLEDSEIKEIMRMVKTIGHLPNMIYLLAYDREIVWKALDDGLDRIGPKFAEKIVQQELELPKPSRGSLLSILADQTAFLPPAPEGSMRWFYIVQYGIQRWAQYPRDVLRLGNAAKFAWSALEGEIDPHDLLAMEGLKLFDTAAFNWIRDNRDFLFGGGTYQMVQDEAKKEAMAALRQRLPSAHSTQVMEVVAALFPQAAKWMGDRHHLGGEAHVEIRKRRGVGSEAGYDSYFALHPSHNAILKVEIDRAEASLNDPVVTEALIRSYLDKYDDQGEPMVGMLLDELHLRFLGKSPAHPTQALLDVLFRVGEEISAMDWTGRELALPPRAKIWFLIKDMLELWGIESAGTHLLEAFGKTEGVSFRADVYVECGRASAVFESNSPQAPLVNDEDFKALGEQLLPDILMAAQEGALERAPYYFDIIRAWAHLGNPDEVKAWVSQGMMHSAEFMVKTGRGLMAHSMGRRPRTYHMREAPDSSVYDLEVILAAGKKHLAEGSLDEDARNSLSEMVRGARACLSLQSETSGADSENMPDTSEDP